MKCQDKCCYNCVRSSICDEWRKTKPELKQVFPIDDDYYNNPDDGKMCHRSQW